MAVFYRAKHILLEDADDLDYIMEKLHQGVCFETLAEEFSACESAKKGGDLGTFSSGTMIAEFERALYNMEPGEIKAGVLTKYGCHIILRVA